MWIKQHVRTGLSALCLALTFGSLAVIAANPSAALPTGDVVLTPTALTSSRTAVHARVYNDMMPAIKFTPVWTHSSTDQCDPGSLSAQSMTHVLNTVNWYREIAGIGPVTFTAANNTLAQKAALLQERLGPYQLSHFPPPSTPCYDSAGDLGSKSNLTTGTGAFGIEQFITDPGANNTVAGHRYSTLRPEITRMGFGGTTPDGGSNTGRSALWVHDTRAPGNGDSVATSPDWIAWPPPGFVPARIEPGRRWSLTPRVRDSVNFADAVITMTGPSGALSVTKANVASLPGQLTWDFVDPTYPKLFEFYADRVYNVRVSGLKAAAGGAVLPDLTWQVTVIPPPKVVETTPLTVTGDAIYGHILTANAAFEAGASRMYVWRRDGVDIYTSPSGSYTVQLADIGHQLTVSAYGYRDYYASNVLTSNVMVPVPESFMSTPPPTISSPVIAGSTVYAGAGYSPTVSSWTFHWLVDGVEIPGQSAASLVVPYTATGKQLSLRVDGARTGFTTVTTTSASALVKPAANPPQIPGAAPAVTGDPVVGNTLAASASWSPNPDSVSYQWLRDGTPIAGAVGATYSLAAGDAGHQISVVVTAVLNGYATTTRTSAAVTATAAPIDPVTPPTTTFSTKGMPSLPNLRYPQALTVNPGTWSPTPVSYEYQWFVDGESVTGATGATYKPTAAQAGHRIEVRVTGVNGVIRGTMTSAEVPYALGLLKLKVRPKAIGTPARGQILRVALGKVSVKPSSTKYQWFRGATLIKKATKRKYLLTKADRGKKISCKVTYRLAGYKPLTTRTVPRTIR